jgi:hypothetical protein
LNFFMRKYLWSSWLKSLDLSGNLTGSQFSSIFNPDFPLRRSLDANFRAGDRYFHRDFWQNPALGETSFFSLQPNAELCKLRFCAHLMFYIVNWAFAELKIEISIGLLMCDFNCSHSAVCSALANGFNPTFASFPNLPRRNDMQYACNTLDLSSWLGI